MPRLRRILLVEDDVHDVELTLNGLARHNLANRVDVTYDGEEALDYLYYRGDYHNRQSELPLVIFLDIKMPKIDGLEVLRTIKNDPALKMIPVVMVTSSAEERDRLESYQSHANAYVVKPVDFQKLVEVVQTSGLFWALVNEPPPHVEIQVT